MLCGTGMCSGFRADVISLGSLPSGLSIDLSVGRVCSRLAGCAGTRSMWQNRAMGSALGTGVERVHHAPGAVLVILPCLCSSCKVST